MATTYGNRTFDRVASLPDAADEVFRVQTLYVSREDRVLQSQIDELRGRVQALESGAIPSPPEPPQPSAVFWTPRFTLDQGAEGECVGYSGAHVVSSDPMDLDLQHPGEETEASTAEQVYVAAQRFDGTLAGDEQPTPETEQAGATVRSGCKALVQLGLATSYHRAQSFDECIAALTDHGPLYLGIDWHDGMMDPDANGFIHPTGSIAGGHAIECDYIAEHRDVVALHNSWGDEWGITIQGVPGHALLKVTDLARLLAADGEAWLVR